MAVVADSSDPVGQWVADSVGNGRAVDLESLARLAVVDRSPFPSHHIPAAAGQSPCRSRVLRRAGQEIHARRQDLGSVAVVGTDWVAGLGIRIAVVVGMEAEGRGIDFAVAEVADGVRHRRTTARPWSAT